VSTPELSALAPANDPAFPNVWDEIVWRGLVHVSTDQDALRALLGGDPITYYCGFDPTAPSLHLGNLVQLLLLRRLQLAGHKPLGLVGGSTGLIGDPRPTAERTLNTKETVGEWVAKLRAQVEQFLSFEGANAARLVNNLDWTAPLSAIDFLRDIGKHYRVGTMLKKDAVSARLNSEAGISYTEFSYQILQGLDYLELFRSYDCVLQTGGSDQWGNLTSGTDLIHRVEGVSAHAIGTPLITNSDGTKFGKPVPHVPVLAQHARRRCDRQVEDLHVPDQGGDRRLREAGRRRAVPAGGAASPRGRGHDDGARPGGSSRGDRGLRRSVRVR
jgi:tyrosyl-tRNA synthetase